MNLWQVDFYKRPPAGDWELLACDRAGNVRCRTSCPQAEANSDWAATQLDKAANGALPAILAVFRPQSLGLLTAAAEKLGIRVVATRRTEALKQILERDWGQSAIAIDSPPPQALPDALWGERWRFASLPAGELIETFRDLPIPILELPESLHPLNLGIAAPTPIPGIVIDGGRQAMRFARWLQGVQPYAIDFIPTAVGESGGLVLEAGLADRWVLITFEDAEVARSAQTYNQRKRASQGLHFLLVRPDDSGMTQTGFWLLR